jgi:hypothetical protein
MGRQMTTYKKKKITTTTSTSTTTTAPMAAAEMEMETTIMIQNQKQRKRNKRRLIKKEKECDIPFHQHGSIRFDSINDHRFESIVLLFFSYHHRYCRNWYGMVW